MFKGQLSFLPTWVVLCVGRLRNYSAFRMKTQIRTLSCDYQHPATCIPSVELCFRHVLHINKLDHCLTHSKALSGKMPWFELPREAQVIIKLSQNEHHTRPEECPFVTDVMWGILSECWKLLPASRPSAASMKSRMLLLYYRSLSDPIGTL